MNLHVERWRHAVAALQSDVTVQEREFDQVPRAQNYDVILAFSSIHKPKQFRIQLFQKKTTAPESNTSYKPNSASFHFLNICFLVYSFWPAPSVNGSCSVRHGHTFGTRLHRLQCHILGRVRGPDSHDSFA